KGGHHDFLMIDGPQPFGNAAGGRYGELAFPTGAHYLPLPSPSCFHVREILSDAGIILRNASSERPYYDERFLLHAPEERLLINGKWQEGLIPHDGLPPWEVEEQRRFLADMERLRTAHGKDGKPAFTLPSALSSNDPQWRALDGITMKAWMESHGFRSPALHWYVNYCCRDDYGARYDRVSAWAGLHYFCGRSGEAENAEKGAWLTWPGGLQPLADVLARACEGRRRNGTAARIRMGGKGIEATCIEWINGQPRSYTVHARKAICAMPLFVAARVVEPIAEFGFDPEAHMPAYAPWMVTNFLMKAFPQELPEAPLSWDNVVYGEPGLGYVVSTHQDVRVRPPEKTVFTSYAALTDRTPEEARRWLDGASPGELLEFAAADLKAAYGWRFGTCVERADITLRAHAMATPQPGFLANEGLKGLREADGVLLFAHSDLSGFSVFEEAAWWGYQAALRAVA
ncbi:MAG: amine oxidase, partial [Paucimonas sp.]|nr:amine oxidase [Paucimonas sp.]